jgi:hypothetical protein
MNVMQPFHRFELEHYAVSNDQIYAGSAYWFSLKPDIHWEL